MSLDDEPSAGDLLNASRLPMLEARALLAHRLSVSREQLIARPEQRVAAGDARAFLQLAERRRIGEPLAYLLGEKEFYGRMFTVSPAVLIPRPETELLIEAALRIGPRGEARVLDLGTGSGCIAITLALERTEWTVTATDLSCAALDIARSNADKWHANNVTFQHGDGFSATGNTQFDLIVSNPPYVATADPHLHTLRFEPIEALTAGEGGLACLRSIIAAASLHLTPGGTLALEHGDDQASAVRDLFAAHGWHDVWTERDLAGLQRVTFARAGAV